MSDLIDLGPYSMIDPASDAWEYPNFRPFELRHRFDDRVYIVKEFLERVQELRIRCGFGMEISSYYRSPFYNDQVSNSGLSGPHTTGRAIDILVSGAKAHALLKQAFDMGFTGIGVKQSGPWDKRFVHIDDIETGKRPRVWDYP